MIKQVIRMLFWFWFKPPEVGDRFVHVTDASNPWNTIFYTVVERKGDWYRLKSRTYEYTMDCCTLISFYRKVPKEPDNDQPPF